MEQEILERLKKSDEKIDKIYISVEKTRKYLLWTFITTIVVLVLPLVGLMFAIPSLVSQYSSISGTIGL